MLNNIYLGLKFSFSYFSIVPINFKQSDDLSQKDILGAMLLFFPFVGFVLGTGTVVLFSFLDHLGWYGALFSALFYMISYGFLHTEAIIDVADALYASHSQKNAYAIIKEPTVGAMGVLYAMALVILKLAGIVYLFEHNFFMEFIAILIISRLSLLMLFRIHTFRSSFATQLKNALIMPYIITVFLLFSLLGTLFLNQFILLLIVGMIFALLISFTLKKRLGFVNGDVLGATLEGVEILLFLGVTL